jgi:hypothetical protein
MTRLSRNLMNALLTICLLIVMAGCVTSKENRAKLDASDLESPDFFPILPWDPYHGWSVTPIERQLNGLDSIAACDFNMAGFVLPRDLARCRKLGLGAIVLPVDPAFTNVQYIYNWKKLSDAEIDRRVKSLVAAAGTSTAIKGYFITDEPGASEFPALGKTVAAVKKYAPGKLAYINLFPDYATMGAPDISQLGTSNYTEYLERFVREVNPQVISYDNYMVQYSMDLKNQKAASDYFVNMLAVRRVALEHHLPYLNIVASSQLQPSSSIPSPANLAFQAYSTLAAGYRGVTWYTYFGDNYPYAPISKSGEKTLTWSWLNTVNHQVATLAPVMSRLTSTGVFFSDPPPAADLPRLPGDIVESVASSSPVMVGEFKHQNGGAYVMVVNLSLEKSIHFTLKTKSPEQPISIVSAIDGSFSPFNQKGGLWLAAGQGVLLVLGT